MTKLDLKFIFTSISFYMLGYVVKSISDKDLFSGIVFLTFGFIFNFVIYFTIIKRLDDDN